MIQAVVFDLDDTLFPEEEYVYSGYRAVSKAVNETFSLQIYDDLIDLFQTGMHAQAFDLALRRHMKSVQESYLLTLVQVYREHEPDIHLFREVVAVLDDLKDRYHLALISDGHLAVQERKLQRLNLSHYFAPIVFSDQWGREFWKPHVRPFQECARQLNLTPAAMVYVGDNPAKDFVTARKLGMITVRVRRPGTLHYLVPPNPGFESDHEIGCLDELQPLLNTLEGTPANSG